MEDQKPDTQYTRVLPRDLFNEAKLLKCMGRLCLLIEDGTTPVKMSFKDNGKPFKIGLMEDGYLTIVNLPVYIKAKPFRFRCQYNSQQPYPLFCENENNEYPVFTDSGDFDTEFIDFCNTL